MEHANLSWEGVFAALTQLRDHWPAPVTTWAYDRRLKCVMSSIPTTAASAAEAAIALALPRHWTAETLASASPAALSTTEACGGLRASQRIYWSDDRYGAFGLWWPWGDGLTVSLRIGLHAVDVPKDRYPLLRDVFGIPQAAAAPPG